MSSILSRYRRPTSLYSKLRSRYKPARSGGGRGYGGYRAKNPYILRHNFQYQSKPKYRPKPEPRSSPVIIHKTEPNPYRMPKPDYKPEPDVEDILKKYENRLNEKFIEQFKEVLEKMNEPAMSVEDMKKELEGEAEKVESREVLADDEAEAKRELYENETSQEESEKDKALSDEAEVLSEGLADEEINPENSAIDSENSTVPETIENPGDPDVESDYVRIEPEEQQDLGDMLRSLEIPDMPPEEATEPNESFVEAAEAVFENSALSNEIDLQIWPEIEALVLDLETEQLEPEEEIIEPGY